jgi:hypothetical protein
MGGGLMLCKWKTSCARCFETIEVGEEMYFVPNVLEASGREKICQTCAHLEGYCCDCGATKKPEHLYCWDCKIEHEQAAGVRCACGKTKNPKYATCYHCKMAPQTKEA